MGNITVNEIFSFFGTIAGGITSIGVILAGVNAIFNKKLKPINTRLNEIEVSSDKNFIVRFLADIEQGNEIDEVERERFYEIYQRYKELGGNSYVSHKVEKLQKEGKL